MLKKNRNPTQSSLISDFPAAYGAAICCCQEHSSFIINRGGTVFLLLGIIKMNILSY